MQIDEQEYEAMKRDALRYRWLRAHADDWELIAATNTDAEIDAYIDAAIEQEKKE